MTPTPPIAAVPAQPDAPTFTDAQIASACMSYRHDFGLLEPDERAKIMFTAREWKRAFAKERQSAAQGAAERAVPHDKLTMEIDNVLSDPDTTLSPGAERALRWCRTWVSVPLCLAAHVQTPAQTEHVDADVSKNGLESNMTGGADPTPDELRAIARKARDSSGSASDDCGPSAYVLYGWRAAMLKAPSIEDLCSRIKAADDSAADRDYMLDSNDCIAVLRGEWKAPLAMDKPDRAASHGQAPAGALQKLADAQEPLGAEFEKVLRDNLPELYAEADSTPTAHAAPATDALSVTNILIDIVPGLDGMGHEVYAKSVKDVEDKLSAMGQELEDWQLGIRKYAPAAGAVAGPGWKLVPVEPTPRMWTAGGAAIKACGGHERDAASLAYTAMLAAAPSPAAQAPAAGAVAGPVYRIRNKKSASQIWTQVSESEYRNALTMPAQFDCEEVAPTPAAQADSVPPMTEADAQRYAEMEASSGACDFAAGIPQADSGVQEDAARYRWLRDTNGLKSHPLRNGDEYLEPLQVSRIFFGQPEDIWTLGNFAFAPKDPKKFDNAIDAAIDADRAALAAKGETT